MPPNLQVSDNKDEQRYEASVNGGVAFAAYQPAGEDTLIFTHTEVPEESEGGGVGSALVKAALDDVRAQGMQVVPQCPFVAAYIERHPEYADLVRG